jgi:hypothetical protein
MDAIVINPISQWKYYIVILALAVSIRYDEMNMNFIKNSNRPPMARPTNWKIAIQPGKNCRSPKSHRMQTLESSSAAYVPFTGSND